MAQRKKLRGNSGNIFELYENENTMQKNLWGLPKSELTGNFITLSALEKKKHHE